MALVGLSDPGRTCRSAGSRRRTPGPAETGSVGHSTGMHEAGAVGAALERVIHAWPADKTSGQLEIEIRDATRAEAGSVTFYAAAILADHGFAHDHVHRAVPRGPLRPLRRTGGGGITGRPAVPSVRRSPAPGSGASGGLPGGGAGHLIDACSVAGGHGFACEPALERGVVRDGVRGARCPPDLQAQVTERTEQTGRGPPGRPAGARSSHPGYGNANRASFQSPAIWIGRARRRNGSRTAPAPPVQSPGTGAHPQRSAAPDSALPRGPGQEVSPSGRGAGRAPLERYSC